MRTSQDLAIELEGIGPFGEIRQRRWILERRSEEVVLWGCGRVLCRAWHIRTNAERFL